MTPSAISSFVKILVKIWLYDEKMGDGTLSDRCKFDLDELRKRLRRRGVSESSVELLLKDLEGWRCNREAYKGGYCIFHSEDKPDDFEDRFWDEFRRAERDSYVIEFIGAILPPMEFSSYKTPLKARKPVVFLGAEFLGDATFQGAEFLGGAYFGGAEFHLGANFNGAKFHGRANFNGAIFHGYAFFRDAEFSRGADFLEAEFQGNVNIYSSINGVINFGFSTFRSAFELGVKSVDGGSDYALMFYMVDFREPRKVLLAGFPLSAASFLRTDLTDVILVPSKGPPWILDDKLLKYKRRMEDTGDEVAEESGLRKALHRVALWVKSAFNIPPRKNPLTLTDAESSVYRRLDNFLTEELVIAEYKSIRRCLEENRMFAEAGDLFVSEMRLARRRLSWKRIGDIPEKLAHLFYDLIARYGESLGRPLVFYASAILAASVALVWALTGDPTLASSLPSRIGNLSDALSVVGRHLEKVFAVSLQIRSFKDFFGTKAASSTSLLMIEALLRVLSLIFLGSFFIALKRRLERK